MRYTCQLVDPWDAAWIANLYPETFTLVDSELGIVGIGPSLRLDALADSRIDLIMTSDGFLLRVYDTRQPLIEVN